MIGAGRVVVYRTLHALEADGFVERDPGGGIRVLDEEGLAQLVEVAARMALRLCDRSAPSLGG